jgi:hypothetical protein
MTITELKRKVLEKLQVIAAGEGVQASDGALVLSKYESLHEVLLQDELIEWAASEDIPGSHEAIMVNMVAAECIDEFYCPDSLKISIVQQGKFDINPPSIAERRLRKLAAPGYSGEPAQPDYY